MAQSRRMLVLRAVVEDYIRSQEPVGSTSLTREHNLGVSSATIRNDMAALEDEGYLIQPHTSAGRVPTEKGYRYFVDRLATVMPLSEAQRRGINSFLSGSASLQDALQRAARLLSQITGQVAIVASPSLSKATLRHVELVPISMGTLLAVVITDTGRVAQHGLSMNPMPPQDDINRLSATINAQCAGASLSLSAERVRAIASTSEYRCVAAAANALADAFETMALDEKTSELYMSGVSSLAHQRSLDDLASLFDALEEQVVLMKLMSNLSEEANATGVGVAIGSETHTPGLLHASVVTSGYGRRGSTDMEHDSAARNVDGSGFDEHAKASVAVDGSSAAVASNVSDAAGDHATSVGQNDDEQAGETVAFVGSIGPTHMDYATTIAAVRAVARYLTAFLSQNGAADPPTR
ncbi:HrcA family transcriptional regulator [Bifidobacterium sp. DSM 109957]|uniref:Heat-inducible transcription repressor HrcA n=1 Tax=Bifidobacterium oedipodis TaxID=2675322 RepID=A0A7Y0EPV8_9BIFI|nr:heat-inducible transcriptional repressor HrcA [Bifidobacterium sp. DSM 109957]NMM94242.1 HrcA family transcriptional regulator [Bifidobacterium sp. DSM 109957]